MPHIANSAIIAAAVNALPSLLTDLEAAQKREKVLREALRGVLIQIEGTESERTGNISRARAALSATEVKP
jgi:hypothetical protein